MPGSAPILGPMYLRNSDWVGAEEAADKIENAGKPPAGVVPPAMQQKFGEMQRLIAEGGQRLQELAAENEALKRDVAGKQADREVRLREIGVKQFEAETERMRLGI